MSGCPLQKFTVIFQWKSFESLKEIVDHRKHLNVTGENGDTPLHGAACNSDPRVVKMVLSKSADINVRDEKMRTPLHRACRCLNFETTKVLIDNGADVFAVDERGKNAIYFALAIDMQNLESIDAEGHTHWDMIQLLLDNGLDINSRDNLGETSIFGIHHPSASIVQQMIDHGADINVISKEKVTPMLGCCSNEAMLCLLKNGSVVNVLDRNFSTPIRTLSLIPSLLFTESDVAIVAAFLRHGASARTPARSNISILGKPAMYAAADLIKLLLNYGADINAPGAFFKTDVPFTPLQLAVQNYLTFGKDGVKLLLAQGANVRGTLGDPVRREDWELIEELIERGADLKDGVFEATRAGLEMVKYFVGKGVDPRSFPIHFAESYNEEYIELLTYFLDLGLDIDSRDVFQETALHKAVSSSYSPKNIEFLIEKGADVNATDVKMRTPLHFITFYVKYVEILVKHGANVNARDIDGNTPFLIYCRHKELSLVKTIVEAGADIYAFNNDELSGLHIAADIADLENVEYLVQLGLDVNYTSEKGEPPIFYTRSLDVLSFFINKGCDIHSLNKSGETLLYRNIYMYPTEVIDMLLHKGVDLNLPNAEGVTPLHRACQNWDNWPRVQKVLKEGANMDALDQKGRNVLHYACKSSGTKLFEMILELGVPLNSTDYENKNVLHYAAENENIELVRDIYERDPSLNCADKNGHYPLYYCSSRKLGEFLMPLIHNIHPENLNGLLLERPSEDEPSSQYDPLPYFRKLINMGAAANSTDHLGNTPLHNAALRGSCKAMRLLIDAGASVNALNGKAKSPIHSAIKSKNLDAVKLLVTAGADMSLIDNKNRKLQQFAWRHSAKIAEYFKAKSSV